MERQTVAIVGAGFSGTLLARHLLRQPTAPNIVLLEREHALGRGVAYSTHNLNHRLNVPAGRMSAFADDPSDFLRWLNDGGHGGEPGDFAPRWLFGCYVRQRLAEAARVTAARLEVVHGDATAIEMGPAGGMLELRCGRRIRADQIVLAMGNHRPQQLPMADAAFLASPYYRGDPWAPDALAGLDPDAPVLLVGSGLTMVDVVVSLLDASHRGPIQAISRRGLLPQPHVAAHHASFALAEAYPVPLSHQLQYLRREARRAAADGVPWQAVMDSVRHRVQEIWCRASEAERRRFLRHARPWWDIHRHRIAPAVAIRIDQARLSGQLRIDAGRISTLTARPGGVDIVYTPRRRSEPVSIQASRVINCTGPASDVTRSDDPLLQSLLAQNLAAPDTLRLGLNVSLSGELLRADGTVAPNLYAVGPATKGAWWEITSVPDIRRECARLAQHLSHQAETRATTPA
jgi:uncharacterized NAD(P)/FAD-binding protein YdhS